MDHAKLVDLYIRRSKDGKLELSTTAQERRGRAWAAANGLTVRTVWTDKVSGSRKDVKRPDYDKALLALRSGDVRTLWSYKLDRFSRMGALVVLTALGELGTARVIFDADGLDSSNPDHLKMIMWRAQDAKEEADRIGSRLRDTFAEAKDAGLWVPARVPYGFIRSKKRKLKVDPKTSPVVRRIFADAVDKTCPVIVRELNAEGIPSPTGGRWGTSTVYGILRNPAYAGWATRLDGDTRVTYRDAKGQRVRVGKAIVTNSEQARATKALSSRSIAVGNKRRGQRSVPSHLLTGLLRCASCNRTLIATGKSYACTANSLGGRACGNPATAMRGPVETAVVDYWVWKLTTSEDDDPFLHAVGARWLVSHKPDAVAARRDAANVLESAQAALADLVAARYKRHEFDGAAGDLYPNLLTEAEADVSAARAALDALPEPAADIGYLMDHILVTEAWEAASLSDRRDLLRLGIDSVSLTKAEKRGQRFDPETRLTFNWAGAA